jgi:hypothetical protein
MMFLNNFRNAHPAPTFDETLYINSDRVVFEKKQKLTTSVMSKSCDIVESQTSDNEHVLQRVNSGIMDNIICVICYGILVDPRECKSCQQAFCSHCINHWKALNNKCPLKCAKLELIEPHRSTLSLLHKLTLKCVNYESGCKQVLRYQALSDHEKKCDFKLQKCTAFNLCKTECFKQEMEVHERQCEYIHISCQMCRKMFIRRHSMIHQSECEFQIIKCKAYCDCKIADTRKEIFIHEKQCKYIIMTCEECMQQFQRKHLRTHDCVVYLLG